MDQKLTTFICRENYEDLLVLTELIEAGKVTPVIDRTYPLSEAPKAIRYLEQGHARGKVVITIWRPPKGPARPANSQRVNERRGSTWAAQT